MLAEIATGQSCLTEDGDDASLPPTHPPEDLTALEERNRSLELAKYFAASQVQSASQAAIGDEAVAEAPTAPAADTTLTALAQLGTFKLGCDRAFISLINSTHQYIIGEATQSTSLLDNSIRSEDGLYLGVRALELAFGVCPQTIQIFTSDDRTICTPNVYADNTRYIIKDFTADSHFASRPYVKGWPHMRSYAEVPLKCASGYVIGSYCVVDTRPRDFDETEIRTLNDVGITIMNHLELLKSKLEFCRVQRLVRGIGSYVAGYSGLQEHQTGPLLGIAASNPLLEPVPKTRCPSPKLTREDSDDTVVRPGSRRVHTDETIASQVEASSATSATSSSTRVTSKPDSADELDQRANTTLSEPLRTGDCAHEEMNLSHDISAAVSRASYLMRHAMDLDGVVFVQPHADTGASTSSLSASVTNGQGLTPEHSMCAVIGHSTDNASIQGDASKIPGFKLSHDLLQRLLRRYPFGHVFSHDDLGVVPQSSFRRNDHGRSHPSRPELKRTESMAHLSEGNDVAELFAAAKGARSIAFTTLWDYRKDKWFAASISWTTDSFRVFDVSELNYLSAFGNSITAEVSRLEVSALSKAKSDFISSISHELRSPLHGILAGVEILRDTMKLESEVSMLDSIDACGSLLLDTINHLLDYSKITNLSKRKQGDPSESLQDNESKTEVFPIVDLSTLVHDVVDGVCLGNIASEKASDRETLDDTALTRSFRQGHPDQNTLKLSETGSLATLIDIDPSIDWKVKTEAAAWKRIVMNLFGNAMKFTQQGQITVRLRLAPRRNAESEAAQHICVDVYDTGSGISKDYLNSYLFTPFSQESDISVGTGVGLSIVQKLVEGLGGSIDVQSHEGSGTRISVAIPLGKMTFPVNGQGSLLCEDAPLYANGRHKGNTLYVQSPATYPDREHDKSTDLTTTADVDSNIRTFFANLAQHGFGMRVVVGSSNNDEPKNDGTVHSISLNGSNSGGAWTLSRSACLTGENAGNSKSNRASVRVRQPFGPRAFASALDKIMAFTAIAAQSDNASALKAREMEICNEECNSPSLSLRTSLSTEENAPVVGGAQDQHVERTNGMVEKGVQTKEPNQKPEKREATAGKVAAHLLLVDDNAINLKVLAASVKKGGCTFDQAMNGKEALEIFKLSTSTYDLVFMDLSMPIMNGIEATRKIREYERGTGNGKHTRIIALTALGNEEHRQRAFASGVDGFMTKPVKMKEIRKLAEQAGGC